jgi:hypothetical protein
MAPPCSVRVSALAHTRCQKASLIMVEPMRLDTSVKMLM